MSPAAGHRPCRAAGSAPRSAVGKTEDGEKCLGGAPLSTSATRRRMPSRSCFKRCNLTGHSPTALFASRSTSNEGRLPADLNPLPVSPIGPPAAPTLPSAAGAELRTEDTTTGLHGMVSLLMRTSSRWRSAAFRCKARRSSSFLARSFSRCSMSRAACSAMEAGRPPPTAAAATASPTGSRTPAPSEGGTAAAAEAAARHSLCAAERSKSRARRAGRSPGARPLNNGSLDGTAAVELVAGAVELVAGVASCPVAPCSSC